MNEIDLLKRTAHVVNDKYIDIEIDIIKPTILERVFHKTKRVYTVRRACLATLISFSELALSLKTAYGGPEDQSISEQLKAICTDALIAVKMIAMLLLDTDEEPSNKDVRFLLKNLDNDDYHKTLMILVDHSRIENFMNSIILVKGMSLLKTKEMIAFDNKISGESLEEL